MLSSCMGPGPLAQAGTMLLLGCEPRGIASVAAPLPLTTLADDVATLERVDAPVVLVGYAYPGDPRTARRRQ